MKKKSILINRLEYARYSYVTGHNVSQATPYSIVFASSYSLEPLVTYRYTDLTEKLKTHFGVDTTDVPSASSLQQYRNHLSALNGFLASVGKTVDANIGVEFGSLFGERLLAYLSQLDLGKRTISDRGRMLKMMQRIYKEWRKEVAEPTVKVTTLSIAIREAIARNDIPPKTLAKRAEISPTTLSRWMNGANLNARGFPSLRRLEASLNLKRDELVALVRTDKLEPSTDVAVPSYRRKVKEVAPNTLILTEAELGATFIEEWFELFKYKTGGVSFLKRQAKATWRQIPSNTSPTLSPLATRNDKVCPTADIVISILRSFLGVTLNLPISQGGFNWTSKPDHSLALLAHPALLETYINWITDRSNGVMHNGQKVFAQAVASLVRPITGFLWQQPEIYMNRLPEAFRPNSTEEWKIMCEECHGYLRDVIRKSTGHNRSPFDPIAHLLDLDNPLEPIFKAIEKIDSDASKCIPGSVGEARHKRNALLIAVLISNPLRCRTISSLTWRPDGTGSVRGNHSSGWRIRLEPTQLKNGASKRSKNYDVKVAQWIQPRLEEYIEEYRATLLGDKKSDFLFVGDEEGEYWEGLSATVRKIARKYIPGSDGIGTHAIRHLVATDWLRNYPGDYLTLAELLNDRIETVIENYAHLKKDDSFSRYEEHIAKVGASDHLRRL